MYTRDLRVQQSTNKSTKIRDPGGGPGAARRAHTCWRVSRARWSCWWHLLWCLVQVSPIAPPSAAAGGRKSRKYEPQCCWKSKEKEKFLSSSLSHVLVGSQFWTTLQLCINIIYSGTSFFAWAADQNKIIWHLFFFFCFTERWTDGTIIVIILGGVTERRITAYWAVW